MATTINKTDGTVLTSIADGAVDISSTNLALIGRLYRNYGELINENLVKLLENFANSSSPSTPIVGQIWYDTSDKKLKVYRSTGFVPLAVSTNSTTEPSSPTIGDFWYDTVDAQLKTWNGSNWFVIAPAYTATQGKTGAFAENIADTLTTNHIAVLVYQSGQVIAAFSNDAEYTPSSAITGFTSIKKGITLSNNSGIKLHGSATNAELLDSLDSTQFLRSDANDTATGTLTIENTQPLVLGAGNETEINVTTANTDIVKTNSGAIRFYLDNTDLVMQLNDDKQIVAEVGTSTAPSITFNGDTNTGIYSPTTDSVAITAAGTARLTVNTTGASVNGTFTATSVQGNVSATSGTVGTLTTTTITPTFISGTPTFTNNVLFGADLAVNGGTTLGNASGDTVTINAGTLDIPNGLTVTSGDISTAGEIAALGDITAGDDLFVTDEFFVQYDVGTGEASFRVDSSGRILVNVAGAAVAASNTGDATFGDTAHVYAANTAKWWTVWKDNTDVAQFAFLGEHHVDSITRESNAGEYKINLDYSMTAGSYWSVVGMGAYGNMNMLEFPVGGAYVRVKNELYDYTGTRDSSYNSVVAFGV